MVQLGAGNPYQSAGRVQPERTVVIFHRPMNSITGQSILAGKRAQSIVLQPAEPAFGRDPEGTVIVELEVTDAASAKPIRRGVRCADLPVREIGHAA